MTDINTSSDERKVTIPASMLTQPIANYGGYVATKCIACGAQGWEGQLQHKPECPVNAQPAAPAEVVAPDDEWRRLALQFDGHRMQALACIKALLNAPERHRAAAYEFLAAPPLSGEQVLADRIAALASPAQAPAAPSVGEPVYLVATGETVDGQETYTRHEGAPPPLCDFERLYATPPAAPAATEAPSGVRVGRIEVINGRTVSWAFEQFDGVPDGEHAMYAIATPAPAVGASKPGITLDFKQAAELLEMFGGEPTEITLMVGLGHSGEGLYAVYNADPEGAIYLGQTDEDAIPAVGASVQPVLASLSDEQIDKDFATIRYILGVPAASKGATSSDHRRDITSAIAAWPLFGADKIKSAASARAREIAALASSTPTKGGQTS